MTFDSQVSIAHTRWATHGVPSEVNCHPLKSDPTAEFCIVHNGIVTNYNEIRMVLSKRGYKFESDTDTEAVAILTKYVYDSQPDKRITFTELVKTVLKELEGSFAFVFKSKHYPNEIVTARRGSPLLVGVKTDRKLKVDFVDVEFAGQDSKDTRMEGRECQYFPGLHNQADATRSPPELPCWPPRPSLCQPQGSSHPVSRVHVR